MNTINAETKPVFVVVSEEAGKSVTTVQAEQIVVVTAISRGPLGPRGPQGKSAPFKELPDVDAVNAVDKSVVYYDATAQVFKADSIWTTDTLSDGGNF